jgi:diguanylate cyclase (GGDEF)-like protein/PAS domain S-box-containing protein
MRQALARLLVLPLLCGAWGGWLPGQALADGREVRVGIYDNAPKLLAGADGQPSGILGDLLVAVARQEGWTLIPVPCGWEDCLAALQAGRIDLLPDVAKTPERAARWAFHQTPALQSWSALYVPVSSHTLTLPEFRGKRIAVLAGSVQQEYLQQLFEGMGLPMSLVPVASFDEGFAAVGRGAADAVAANHFYGERNASLHQLKSSSVMFLPSGLYYVTRPGANGDLLAALDRHLQDWQNEEGSPYYQALDNWMASPPATVWPVWWGWVVGGGVAAILVVLLFNAYLRRQVRRQTAQLEDDIRQLQRAEDELARQHDLFQTLIRTIPDLVWLKDPEGVYLACNPRFETFFGASEQAIRGKTDYDFVDRELGDFFRAHDRAAMAAGGPTQNEEWLTFADDGYRGLFETTKTPMRDAGGRLIGVLGIAHDITRRMETEAALRNSEEHLKEAQALARLGDWSLDLVSGTAVWSDEEFRLLGHEPGAMTPTAEHFLNAVHPEDRELVQAAMQRAMDPMERRPYHVVHRVLLPGGERIVEELGKVSFDEAGKPVRMFGTTMDITERKRIENQIEHLAYHDPLTSLPNRALFLDRLHQALAASQRGQRFGAVMFVDLDQFKRINDLHGHSTGDRVLQAVAQRLRQVLRQEDTVARFGGDEFVILLPELATELAGAATVALAVAEKVRGALEQPTRLEDKDFVATASIGISLFPKAGETLEDLIREADIAMYRAKEGGRNALRFFEQDMQARLAERYALEQDLREALKTGGLVLYLQSQVDVHGKVLGAEALVRWQHPGRGLLFPDAFIPLAEESGLIVPMGEWVLQAACTLLAGLQSQGSTLRLAVNVSPRQFQQADFDGRVRDILALTGARPEGLTLEITENLLVDQASRGVEQMRELASLGLRFAIDDFGTGYSSLAYLKRLPLDELKIDKSFVRDLPRDANDAALVETILSMARHLDYAVVAEGVETAEQKDFLAARGCLCFQGYHFHRPEPAADWLVSQEGPIRA